jgi:hypothetical protein
MTHELGHLFGANHDRASAIGLAAFPYAYGWRGCDPSLPMFRTLMAYACGSAIRINYLSTPRLSYAGLPLGVDYDVDPENAADNARVFTETAGLVAGFRASASASGGGMSSGTGIMMGGGGMMPTMNIPVVATMPMAGMMPIQQGGGGAGTGAGGAVQQGQSQQQQQQQGGQGASVQTGGANVTNQSGGVGPEPNAQGVKTFSIKL